MMQYSAFVSNRQCPVFLKFDFPEDKLLEPANATNCLVRKEDKEPKNKIKIQTI
jgi:hypothetical protein